MANFNFQGKIIRQFWGKIIRQSTIYTNIRLQKVTWGGCLYSLLSNKITFFHSVRRIE